MNRVTTMNRQMVHACVPCYSSLDVGRFGALSGPAFLGHAVMDVQLSACSCGPLESWYSLGKTRVAGVAGALGPWA